MNTEKATLKDGRTIEFVHDQPRSGTMKEVYFTPDRKSVVCFYKDPCAGSDANRLQRLQMILGAYNPTLPQSHGGAAQNDIEADYYRKLFCWPTGIVVQPRFGLVTPAYPSNFFFPTGPVWLKGEEKNGMWFIGPKNRKWFEKNQPSELGSLIQHFSLCLQIARAVARLHNAGLAHSDLSHNNVLIDPSKGMSIIIDIDSLVVEGLFPPDVLGTKGYIAPEVLSTIQLDLKDPKRKNPNARTDQHALAAFFYWYLLGRHPLDGRRIPPGNTAEEQDLLAFGSQAIFCEHPSDSSNRPEEKQYVPCSALGPLLYDLFIRAFVKSLHSPSDRPTALEWVRGFVKTWDLLIPCSNSSCLHKWFVFHNSTDIRCPFCGTRFKGTIPFLKLRAESRPGQWAMDGQLAVYNQLPIFKWHIYSRVFPSPETDRTRQAYCVFHEGKWFLVNEKLTSLTSPGGNRVPPGQAVELKDGAQIRFSQEHNGRIAEVQMIRS